MIMAQRRQSLREIISLIPVPLYFLIVIIAFNYIANQKQFPEQLPEITLDREITISTTYGKQPQTYTLHKGDVVQFLGYKKSTKTVNLPRAYVQTADGIRGYFDAYELGYPVIYTKTRDTVTIVQPKSESDSWPKALLRFADGKEEWFNYDEVGTALPKELRKLAFSDAAACYMTETKFQSLYVGKKLDECERLNHPATLINKTEDGGFQAYFQSIFVFNPEEGCFHRPIVTTDNASVITGYELVNQFGNNKWILKRLPFVSAIMDSRILSPFITSSIYDQSARIYDLSTHNYNWTRWIIIIIYPLFGILWLACFGAALLIILRTLMVCRFSFYILSSPVLNALFGLIAIVTGYIWFVQIKIWGLVTPFGLICIIGQFILYRYSVRYLNSGVPHGRCVSCRRLNTMEHTDDIFLEEFDEWREEKKRGRLLDKGTQHIKTTWTETTYSDGSKKKSNVREHYRDYETYEVKHYSVLYHVKLYDKIFTCSCCDYSEKYTYEKLKELDRRQTGTSTATDTRDYSY